MFQIHARQPWNRPGLPVTDESAWVSRRQILKASAATLGTVALTPSALAQDPDEQIRKTLPPVKPPFPVKRSPRHLVTERPVTPELTSAAYNNFYELGLSKSDPWRNADKLRTRPWTVTVKGLVGRPFEIGIEDLLKEAMEERVYRFRCVEAWAATVPWTGFPLHRLLKRAEPKSEATHVRFVTVHQKDLPGVVAADYYNWPYYEGLTMAEAMHELTLVTLGSYGRALPAQHGAPVRLIVPWKYGYKSPKSIVTIEVVKGQPKTFWNDSQPTEYSFESNVDPKVPHPRWSQANERLLGSGKEVPTRYLNGYEKQVGTLYR